MNDIIERLQTAKAPDRDIDAAIQNATDGRILHIGCGGLTNAFTASVDAALMLVPDDCMWSVARYNPERGSAFVHMPNGDVQSASGETPAIALCIASLKARASIADNYEPPDPPGFEGGFAENH